MRSHQTDGVGSTDTDTQRLDLVEERLTVSKETVVSGRVEVRSITETEHRTISETLEGERIDIERVPIGREITDIPQTRVEDGVTIIPIVEEIVVVEKRLVLKEELHLRRVATTETVEIPVELRKQRAVIERSEPDISINQMKE